MGELVRNKLKSTTYYSKRGRLLIEQGTCPFANDVHNNL
jgi:hypothetical protein